MNIQVLCNLEGIKKGGLINEIGIKWKMKSFKKKHQTFARLIDHMI
jgi:hypothetical protein